MTRIGVGIGVGFGVMAEPFQLTGADATQTYSFGGAVSGQTCTGRVYLPAGYNPADATRYPVLLVMHGKGGSSATSDSAFIPELKGAVAASQIRKCIVVMPDSVGADWGTDAFDGSVKAETKIIDDVLPYFELHTRANGTVVATGFSMGGWSVTALAMRNIGTFAAVWAVACPNMDANPVSGNANNWRYINDVFTDLGANDTDDLQAVWGPTGTAPEQASTLALLEAASPTASKNGGALANTKTADIISSLPLFYCKSAADGVSLTSLNQYTSNLSGLGIPHGLVDLVSSTHGMASYYQTAQGAGSIAAGNGFMWLEAKLAGSDVVAPQFVSASVNTAGTQVTLTFDKTLATNSPTASQFTLGGTFCTVASASASGATVTLTLATTGTIHSGATVTVSWTADAATKIQNSAGVPTPPRTSVATTNNSTVTPLTIVTSVPFHFWLRADLGVTQSAGAVSAWADQSGAAHSFSQGTGANQPTFSGTSGPNSGPGITFDGSDDTMSSSAFDIADPTVTPFYAIAIAKQVTWVSLKRFWSAPGGAMQLSQTGTTPALTMRNTTSVNSNTAMTVGSWFRVATKFTGSTSDELKVGATSVAGASAGTTNPASGAFTLGSAGGANPVNAAFAEFMAFAGTPTGTELSELDKYYFGRYGSAVGI